MSYRDPVAEGWKRDAIASAGALDGEIRKRRAAEGRAEAAEAEAERLRREIDFLWAVLEGDSFRCTGRCFDQLLP